MPIIEEDIETKIHVDTQLLTSIAEEGQVIVHCSYYNDPRYSLGDMGVRVWKETYLIDDATGIRVPMIKAIGIVYQPAWEYIPPGATKRFTMIFEALPKHCLSFTLAEIINQPGAFVVQGIPRNKTDVYKVKLD